eukprot:scaffold13612_cov49-Cylindrotheca_fusiformis.AAC.1
MSTRNLQNKIADSGTFLPLDCHDGMDRHKKVVGITSQTCGFCGVLDRSFFANHSFDPMVAVESWKSVWIVRKPLVSVSMDSH